MHTLHTMEDGNGNLPPYAWPGGYPILYLDSDNEILCAECATDALHDDEVQERFKPVTFFHHLEGDSEFCSECNEEIESAY